ncbi:trans-sialidase [Trypanosoma conorhini]|uniref:Trans-sialidase n=1 Tax=Trypanosoma conorhini TaxID=83891 RepID=A0A422PGS0_9TRYP|nr:trans-sialidase [Trypanosoma conorhini]RNF16915.1 trans-sialidase [Trypanosoma conorhini]
MFALYDKHRNRHSSLYLMDLTAERDGIKSVLDTWATVDGAFATGCNFSMAKRDPPSSDCAAPIPTKGLVGFLSGTLEKGKWKDKYRCVDATARNAVEVDNGVMFKGVGAGAEWPVGKEGQVQRYHFANYNFTLVATVSIDAAPTGGGPLPLLGASLDVLGNRKLVGLSYTGEKHWSPVYNNAARPSTMTWELNQMYQVVLMLQDGVASIYVDGVLLDKDQVKFAGKGAMGEISHFYFGSHGSGSPSANSFVTVKDVFLYNRPLTHAELRIPFEELGDAAVQAGAGLAGDAEEGPTTVSEPADSAIGHVSPNDAAVTQPQPPTADVAGPETIQPPVQTNESAASVPDAAEETFAAGVPVTFLPGNSSAAFKNMTDLRPSEGNRDGTLRGYVPRLLLLALLGLWGTTVLC